MTSPSQPHPLRRTAVLAWMLVVLGGFATRIPILVLSYGSDDIFSWNYFALEIRQHGVSWMYFNVPLFNHPPLMAELARVALWVSEQTGVRFAVCFKAPVVASEILSLYVLWDVWRRRRGPGAGALAAAAFAWNLDSILVSAYHGNTDCLFAALCLLSAYFVEERQRHLAGGLALGAAINVKLIPVFLILPFLARYRRWSEAARFTAGMALGALPFVPILIVAGKGFYRNVLAYKSFVDQWGIPLFLLQSQSSPRLRGIAQEWTAAYSVFGRYLTLLLPLAVAILAARSNRFDRYQLGALTLALFLIVAPGFGIQYTVAVVPLLFAVEVAAASVYSLVAGLFAAIVYFCFWDGKWPAASRFASQLPMAGALFGLIAWWVLCAFVVKMLFPPRRRSPTTA